MDIGGLLGSMLRGGSWDSKYRSLYLANRDWGHQLPARPYLLCVLLLELHCFFFQQCSEIDVLFC